MRYRERERERERERLMYSHRRGGGCTMMHPEGSARRRLSLLLIHISMYISNISNLFIYIVIFV